MDAFFVPINLNDRIVHKMKSLLEEKKTSGKCTSTFYLKKKKTSILSVLCDWIGDVHR